MEAGAKPTQMFPGVARVADARFSPPLDRLRFRAVGPVSGSFAGLPRSWRARAVNGWRPRADLGSERVGILLSGGYEIHGRGREDEAGTSRRQTARAV